MATGVFGLKAVYKKQYQNVKSNNFTSWPESAVYGYYGGGQYDSAAYWDGIPRLDFATSTTSFPGNYLPARLRGIASASSNSYGYFAGGSTPSPTTISSSVLRFDFSSESVSNPGNNLPSSVVNAGSVQSSNNAYFGGGIYVSGNFSSNSNIVRFQFSTETASAPGNNLPSERELIGGLSSSSYGYFGGGYFKSNTFPYPATSVSTISRLDFSNESISLPGKNLPEVLVDIGTVSSIETSYGYFAGGVAPPTASYVSTIRRLDFSTENLTVVGSLPNTGGVGGRAGSGSTKSSSSAYFGGGEGYVGSYITTTVISKLDLSNTTVTDLSNGLPLRVRRPAGISGGASVYRRNGFKTYGYFGGGYSPPYLNTISRLDFSTDGFSNPGKNLPIALGWTAAISSNYYGYFGGGQDVSTFARDIITRLDFSNEVVSNPGKVLPSSRFNFAAVSSNSYGYFGGDNPGSNIISRLDFSTENVSNPGKNLPAGRGNLAAVSSSSYGYFGGGYSGTFINTISRLDFSNETVSNPGKNLPVGRENLTAVSSSSYGYFGGGYFIPFSNTISRLDFSTENVSNPGKNLPVDVSRLGGTSSMFFGYFAGGQISPSTRTASVSKIDFSTENISASPSLPSARNILTGLSNSN